MKKYSLLIALLCAACGGDTVQKTLGMERTAPDEFRVVSRPPLTVPKEFYLYPPDEAMERKAPSVEKNARDVLLDNPSTSYKYQSDTATESSVDTSYPVVQSSNLASGAEDALLSKIGVQDSAPEIREVLKAESEALEERTILENLRNKDNEEVVNAEKERERIKEAVEKKQAIDGKTAETVKTKKSTLDWIFE
jgi:Protein of unknown function (DUF3035)